jgi:hypothetical protein
MIRFEGSVINDGAIINATTINKRGIAANLTYFKFFRKSMARRNGTGDN